MKTQLTLLAALALAACNRPEPAPEEPKQAQFEQELRALSESARNLAFRNAIRDFKVRCARVDRSAFQEEVKGAAMWVARCTDSGDYALLVNARGYAQVARCEDLIGENAPRCTALG